MNAYYQRVDKMPPLKEVLAELQPKEEQRMSDDAMLEVVKQLNAQFGGKVVS